MNLSVLALCALTSTVSIAQVGPLTRLVQDTLKAGGEKARILKCEHSAQDDIDDVTAAVDMFFEAMADNRLRINDESYRQLLHCLRDSASKASPKTKRQIGLLSPREESAKWLKEAAEAGDAEGALRYARLMQGPSNSERAEYEHWMKIAATRGHPGAQCVLGLGLAVLLSSEMTSAPTSKVAKEAERWLLACAGNSNRDHLSCSQLLSDYYRNGDSKCQQLRRAAMVGLGRLYVTAYGDFGRHPAKAAFWLNRAIDGGDSSGAGILARLYREGDGVEKDVARADELMKLYRSYRKTQIQE